jgi:hypothetical protein
MSKSRFLSNLEGTIEFALHHAGYTGPSVSMGFAAAKLICNQLQIKKYFKKIISVLSMYRLFLMPVFPKQ